MDNFEEMHGYCSRDKLPDRVKQLLQRGWEIQYVIPTSSAPQYTQPFINLPTSTNYMTESGGTWTSQVTISPASPEPSFEIYAVKYKTEPCPKCSHLNPDRLDREA